MDQHLLCFFHILKLKLPASKLVHSMERVLSVLVALWAERDHLVVRSLLAKPIWLPVWPRPGVMPIRMITAPTTGQTKNSLSVFLALPASGFHFFFGFLGLGFGAGFGLGQALSSSSLRIWIGFLMLPGINHRPRRLHLRQQEGSRRTMLQRNSSCQHPANQEPARSCEYPHSRRVRFNINATSSGIDVPSPSSSIRTESPDMASSIV